MVAWVAGATFVVDETTKWTAKLTLEGRPAISLLGDFWRFVYSENTGAFLSLGADLPAFWRGLIFSGLVAVFLVCLAVYAVKAELPRLHRIGLALALGGGLGNLFDRVVLGYVIDFMNTGIGGLRTGVYNVADVAIMLGLGLLFWPVKREPAAVEQGAA